MLSIDREALTRSIAGGNPASLGDAAYKAIAQLGHDAADQVDQAAGPAAVPTPAAEQRHGARLTLAELEAAMQLPALTPRKSRASLRPTRQQTPTTRRSPLGASN